MTAIAERPLGLWLDDRLFLSTTTLDLPLAPLAIEEETSRGPRHELAVVVLTQCNRPEELRRALASVRAQHGVDLQLVLVVNGAQAEDAARLVVPRLEEDDHFIVLPENAGIPGGRNIGAAAADAQVLMFLDDDAELLGPDVLAGVVSRFAADDGLGAMAIRLVDHEGLTQRRHVPRVGSRSFARSGEVTHFIGAACAVRAEAFRAVEGFEQRFFYAMEESDLSWRLMDAGWSLWYAADLTAFHPRTTPSRHPGHVLLTARNRFWAAWRSLPLLVALAYVSTWTVLAVVRGGAARQVLAGYRQAWASRPHRRPMRWRTVWRMTRLGRPPVL
jgi:GT2 family glycosyltransferase